MCLMCLMRMHVSYYIIYVARCLYRCYIATQRYFATLMPYSCTYTQYWSNTSSMFVYVLTWLYECCILIVAVSDWTRPCLATYLYVSAKHQVIAYPLVALASSSLRSVRLLVRLTAFAVLYGALRIAPLSPLTAFVVLPAMYSDDVFWWKRCNTLCVCDLQK